jgi:hypothetical protein
VTSIHRTKGAQEAPLTSPSWVQRPQGRFLSHYIVEGLSEDAQGDQLGRYKYHALGGMAVHARLGGAVASTLPVVTILGGGGT